MLNFYWKNQYELMFISHSKNYIFLVCPLKMARVKVTPAILKILRAQTVVYKYQFPLEGTRASGTNG